MREGSRTRKGNPFEVQKVKENHKTLQAVHPYVMWDSLNVIKVCCLGLVKQQPS